MKIGVLGGTFDPIHTGHLYIARKVFEIFNLDRVLFMVAKSPPHKRGNAITDSYHRYAMTILALQDEADFYASRLELHREGPSYTVGTLEELAARFPKARLGFIAGSDSLREVHLWKDCDKLFNQHSLVFVQRPGAKVDLDQLQLAPELRKSMQEVEPEGEPDLRPGRSFLLNLAAPDISSTQIRREIASRATPSQEFISPVVYRYIEKYRIYGKEQ